LKNVDKIIEEVMRFEDYRSREEVFAQYPRLAQWWAQEYSIYGESKETNKTSAGGFNR
jgi:2-oxo-4-hydroxy-4-carboxy--5-ureidoimidazoline (OHCU) decarboxylase